MELQDTQQGKALAYAQEAIGLSPSLIPAAAVAGRILASQGNTARATKILGQAWRSSQHPELALIYAHARTGDLSRDRLARVKALVSSAPASLEGDIAVASAAIEAKEWAAARSALEPHVANAPSARVCRLMARIEAGQNRDAGRAREWLAKAARGAPDPVWVAPDGTVSPEWQAVSPKSGALGVFEWKTPPAAPALGGDGDIMAEMSALDVAAIEGGAIQDIAVDSAPSSEKTEIALPVKANAQLPGLDASGPQPGAQIEAGGAQGRGPAAKAELRIVAAGISDEGGKEELKPQGAGLEGEAAPAGAMRLPAAAGSLGKQKPEIRKPKIFVPGPAPDDPGPRPAEGEELTTPLTRFRRPSRFASALSVRPASPPSRKSGGVQTRARSKLHRIATAAFTGTKVAHTQQEMRKLRKRTANVSPVMTKVLLSSWWPPSHCRHLERGKPRGWKR